VSDSSDDYPDDVRIAARSLDRAEALIELGRYEQALPLLAQSLAGTPDDDWLHCRMADVYYHLNQLDKAMEHAGRALHLNPQSDHPHNRLAWIYLERKHFDKALEHARAAISIDADDGHNLYCLAWAELHTGHHKRALAAAESAIKLDPENGVLHGLLGDLMLEANKPARAEIHYREALRHDPQSARSHCNLAIALAARKKLHEAADHYLLAVKLEPENAAYREKLFAHVHHELMDLPLQSQAKVLAKLDPAVQMFYRDQLTGRGWAERLRITSIATLWILGMLLLSLFFTWLTGDDVRKLSLLVLAVCVVYIALFIGKLIIKIIASRHRVRYERR